MHQMLTQLKLARIREIHQEWFDRAAETQMPYPDFLRGLLQEELLAREENQLRRRLKDAGFPFEKTSTTSTSASAPSSIAKSSCATSTSASSPRGARSFWWGRRAWARPISASPSASRSSSAATRSASRPCRPCSPACCALRGWTAGPGCSSPTTPVTSSSSTSGGICPPTPTSAPSSTRSSRPDTKRRRP
jgi:IstB-like ATP binding protein